MGLMQHQRRSPPQQSLHDGNSGGLRHHKLSDYDYERAGVGNMRQMPPSNSAVKVSSEISMPYSSRESTNSKFDKR